MQGVFYGRNSVDPICRFWNFVRAGDSFRCSIECGVTTAVVEDARGMELDAEPAKLLWIEILRAHDSGEEAVIVGTVLDL